MSVPPVVQLSAVCEQAPVCPHLLPCLSLLGCLGGLSIKLSGGGDRPGSASASGTAGVLLPSLLQAN